MNLYRRLIAAALLLTLVLIPLGAFVRLSDAGLGCPDWPGCYGHVTPKHAADFIAAEMSERPDGPVTHAKAWKEMIHRYVAGVLGLLVLAIAVAAWKLKTQTRGSPGLPTVLLGLIVFQALLGMWTVTELLKPLIVTSHLLGGMATLALLVWLWRRERASADAASPAGAPSRSLRLAARVGLVLVAAQIALGGWVSTNYAALACTDFPQCHGEWLPETDFRHGFTLERELGYTAAGELLPLPALTAIHWTHRAGALVVALYLGWLVVRLWRSGQRAHGQLIGGLLAAQLALGIANVLMSLPLALAVAHNFGAALLLASLVALNQRLRTR
jgi:cytochrome c oxidase assembly protein subunit 15